MMTNYSDYPFEKGAKREDENRPFYRFFAANYFATGEGVSHWLKICRNYEPYGDSDHDTERFKEFIGCSPCYIGIEESTEEEFMARYANLIPPLIKNMIERKDQPCLDWETHFHVNYS